MRLLGSLLLAACLSGCSDAPDTGHGNRRGGRYVGIGIYSPGPLWQRMVGEVRSEDQATATLRDDEQVIVVVDTQTGEVRQCGNLSGHCIRMNPWSGQASPIRLSEHAADLEEGEQNAAAANSSR